MKVYSKTPTRGLVFFAIAIELYFVIKCLMPGHCQVKGKYWIMFAEAQLVPYKTSNDRYMDPCKAGEFAFNCGNLP